MIAVVPFVLQVGVSLKSSGRAEGSGGNERKNNSWDKFWIFRDQTLWCAHMCLQGTDLPIDIPKGQSHSPVLAEVCKRVSLYLGFILRPVRMASVVPQVLCVAENQAPAACNPKIKGRIKIFWRMMRGIRILIWNLAASDFLFLFSADPEHLSFPLSQALTLHASPLEREGLQLSTPRKASIP